MKATIYQSDNLGDYTDIPCKLNKPEYRHGQGADGYGTKIQSDYMVQMPDSKRWYRVYITQVSNAGSLWFVAGGIKYFILHFE